MPCETAKMPRRSGKSIINAAKKENTAKTLTKAGGNHPKCPICGRIFGSKALLVGHIKQLHSTNDNTEKSSCKQCGATFKFKKSLLAHEESVHAATLTKKPANISPKKSRKTKQYSETSESESSDSDSSLNFRPQKTANIAKQSSKTNAWKNNASQLAKPTMEETRRRSQEVAEKPRDTPKHFKKAPTLRRSSAGNIILPVKNVECKFCGRLLPRIENWKQHHRKQHLRPEGIPFPKIEELEVQCEYCLEWTKNIRSHLDSEHGISFRFKNSAKSQQESQHLSSPSTSPDEAESSQSGTKLSSDLSVSGIASIFEVDKYPLAPSPKEDEICSTSPSTSAIPVERTASFPIEDQAPISHDSSNPDCYGTAYKPSVNAAKAPELPRNRQGKIIVPVQSVECPICGLIVKHIPAWRNHHDIHHRRKQGLQYPKESELRVQCKYCLVWTTNIRAHLDEEHDISFDPVRKPPTPNSRKLVIPVKSIQCDKCEVKTCSFNAFEVHYYRKHRVLGQPTRRPKLEELSAQCFLCLAWVKDVEHHMKERHDIVFLRSKRSNKLESRSDSPASKKQRSDISTRNETEDTVEIGATPGSFIASDEETEDSCDNDAQQAKVHATTSNSAGTAKRKEVQTPGQRSAPCNLCGENFISQFNLYNHWTIKHPENEVVMSVIAQTKAKYRNHLNVCHKKVHTKCNAVCLLCGYMLTRRAYLAKHWLVKHGREKLNSDEEFDAPILTSTPKSACTIPSCREDSEAADSMTALASERIDETINSVIRKVLTQKSPKTATTLAEKSGTSTENFRIRSSKSSKNTSKSKLHVTPRKSYDVIPFGKPHETDHVPKKSKVVQEESMIINIYSCPWCEECFASSEKFSHHLISVHWIRTKTSGSNGKHLYQCPICRTCCTHSDFAPHIKMQHPDGNCQEQLESEMFQRDDESISENEISMQSGTSELQQTLLENLDDVFEGQSESETRHPKKRIKVEPQSPKRKDSMEETNEILAHLGILQPQSTTEEVFPAEITETPTAKMVDGDSLPDRVATLRSRGSSIPQKSLRVTKLFQTADHIMSPQTHFTDRQQEPQESFTCGWCSRMFKKAQLLLAHFLLAHKTMCETQDSKSNQRFRCSQCGLAFTKLNLCSHIERKHNDMSRRRQ